MSRINPREYESLPSLEVSDFEGDKTVITVSEVLETQQKDGKLKYVLRAKEFPGKYIWLNRRTLGFMVAQLGSESNDWYNARVPVEKVVEDYNGKPFHKVAVADPARWESILTEWLALATQATPTAPARRPASRS